MLEINQVTEQASVATPVIFSGVGLHSGQEARVKISPAPAGAGVCFRRIDLLNDCSDANALIAADVRHVSGVQLGTVIENAAGVSVSTVEHLMAALFICGVDNAVVDIDGPEMPIMDGSAAEFVAMIDDAGLTSQSAPRREIVVDAPCEVRDDDRFIRIEPGERRSLDLEIDFEDAAIGHQAISLDLDDAAMLRALTAPARTFCRRAEIDQMQAAGFARGGSLNNAIVVDGGEILNEGGLRHAKEFALHKALDMIGDLALLGAPLRGRITARKPGHDLNNRFARAVHTAFIA